MNKTYNELIPLIFILKDIYKKPLSKQHGKINLYKLLNLASWNRVLFKAIHNMVNGELYNLPDVQTEHLKGILDKGNVRISRFHNSLSELNEVFDGDEYLLIKTYRKYPYVTHDTDIIVKDITTAKLKLKKADFIVEEGWERYKAEAFKEGMLPIGLHERISWGPITVLDEEILWDESRIVSINDIAVNVPSVEGDLLTYLGHILFEQYSIPLGEFLYLYSISENADWDIILVQAEKYGWLLSLKKLLAKMNYLHRVIFREKSNIETFVPLLSYCKTSFPHFLSLTSIVDSCREINAPLKHLPWDLPNHYYQLLKMNHPHPIDYFHYVNSPMQGVVPDFVYEINKFIGY